MTSLLVRCRKNEGIKIIDTSNDNKTMEVILREISLSDSNFSTEFEVIINGKSRRVPVPINYKYRLPNRCKMRVSGDDYIKDSTKIPTEVSIRYKGPRTLMFSGVEHYPKI